LTETAFPVTVNLARWETVVSTIGALLLIGATFTAAKSWIRLQGELGEASEREQSLEKRKNELAAEIARIKNSPVGELATPVAFRVPLEGKRDAQGRQLFNFMLWLDVPGSRLKDISKVYYTNPKFIVRTRVATEPTNSFAVSYERFECLDNIQITIFDRNGHSSPPKQFDSCKATR
jgi:hypothetical protein